MVKAKAHYDDCRFVVCLLFTLLSFYVAQFYCSLLVNVWAEIFGLYHSDMEISFLYSHAPKLYPIAVSAFDQQCVDDDDDGSNTVLSLVQLSCQKIVQVCGFQGIDLAFSIFTINLVDNILAVMLMLLQRQCSLIMFH